MAILAAASDDAAASCAIAGADEPAPFGSTPCPGVRPGAPVRIDVPPFGSVGAPQCTMGFLLRSGEERYVATAGHCVEANAERTFQPGAGPVAYDGEDRRIGEVAYSVHEPQLAATEFDLALIRLDPGVTASAEMCHFGGPTGLNADVVPLSEPVTLHYYGNAIAGGYVPFAGRWLLPARTGISTGLPNERRAHFHGHVAQVDSGAPVISADGRAVALISVPLGADADGHVGIVNAPRLAHAIERAETTLGIELALATA